MLDTQEVTGSIPVRPAKKAPAWEAFFALGGLFSDSNCAPMKSECPQAERKGDSLSDVTQAALIGAGAATLGSMIGGMLNIGLERLRVKSAREDSRRAEIREATTAFFVAEREWRVAWESLEAGEYRAEEAWIYPLSVKFREASYRMALLVPDEVFVWWRDRYGPLRERFEEVAVRFADEGVGTAADRDVIAEELHEEIGRGRVICRRVLRS